MSVTEVERSEMVNELSAATSPKTVETLMQCVLPDGRDHLATKDDLKVLEHALRADFAELKAHVDGSLAEIRADFAELKTEFAELKTEFAELKGYVDSALAKQTRLIMTTFVGFMIATWTPMLVYLAA